MSVCGAACDKPITATGVTRCSECPTVFHKVCVGIATTTRVPASWACPACKCKSKPMRDNRDNTPVKPIAIDPERVGAGAGALPPGEWQDVAEQLRLLRTESRATRDDIGGLRYEMAEMFILVQSFQTRFQAVENRVAAVEERVLRMEEQMQQRSASGAADSDLAATVAALKLELADRDQDLLLNDIEVTGIPEQASENPVHLTCLVAKKLGVSLEERDVVFAERVGPRRPAPAASGERAVAPSGAGSSSAAPAPATAVGRPRPMVIRLARRGTRSELLRAARVRHGADTSDLGVPGGATRFYLNVRLTRLNRTLLYTARQECKKLDWRYSWTRDGRVYVRRQSGEPARRIRSEEEIKRDMYAMRVMLGNVGIKQAFAAAEKVAMASAVAAKGAVKQAIIQAANDAVGQVTNEVSNAAENMVKDTRMFRGSASDA